MGKDKDQMFHPVRPGVSVTLGDYGFLISHGRKRRRKSRADHISII